MPHPLYTKGGGLEYHSFDIQVKTLTGKRITLRVKPETTVDELTHMICDREGFEPPELMRLVFDSKHLATGTLSENNVYRDSTVHLCLRCKWVGPDSDSSMDEDELGNPW